MGRLGIVAPYSAPMLADDVRRAIAASNDLDALERMRRKWGAKSDGVRVTGKRGPAFNKRG